MAINSLYITYWSLMEPLCQSQSLAYLRRLARHGLRFSLITYERPEYRLSQADVVRVSQQLRAEGIDWHPLPYHKRPTLPATMYDLSMGILHGLKIVHQKQIQVVHARGTTPSAVAWALARMTKAKFLYDADGPLWQEYVDAGLWHPEGMAYRVTQRMQRIFMRDADAIVVLTEQWRLRMQAQLNGASTSIKVIPCCVDLATYPPHTQHSALSTQHLLPGTQHSALRRPVLVYAGSTAGFYLPREMVRFFAALRLVAPDAFFVFLTHSDPVPLRALFADAGVPADRFTIASAQPSDVPCFLAAADAGISFRQPAPSQAAASPIKIAEYLASGLPVVSNKGIGDMDAVLTSDLVGVLVDEFSPQTYKRAARELVSLINDARIKERCRVAAQTHFDIETVAIPRYLRLYEALLKGQRIEC